MAAWAVTPEVWMAERVGSHHPTLLQTLDLADFGFLQIRQNRTKALVDARNAHTGAVYSRIWQRP